VLDPASQWKVTAKRANLEPSKGWDPLINTAPDAFVKVTLGSQTGQTANLSNTYTPVWNADLFTASAASLVSLKMTAEVYDSDWPSGDDLIGSCSISVTASDLLAGAKTVYNCDTNKYILLLEFGFTAM
jgi:Ca2+-dependent lipid-binding protein